MLKEAAVEILFAQGKIDLDTAEMLREDMGLGKWPLGPPDPASGNPESDSKIGGES